MLDLKGSPMAVKQQQATALALAFFAALSFAASAGTAEADPPETAALHVQRLGEAQGDRAVVFLPALNTHRDLWRQWAEPLAASHRVLVVTPAGFPDGPAPAYRDGFYTTLVPALANLLATEDIAAATLVGSSIGGLLALMLAKEQPDRVRNVLVVDGLPYLAGLFLPHVSPAQAPAQAKALAQRARGLPQAAYLQEQLAGLERYTLDPSFRTTLGGWLESADRATSILALEETLALDYRPHLPSIAQPVLVLAAWEAAMPASKAAIGRLFRDQYAGLPNVDVRVVENSRHFVMVDRPEAFEAALAEVVAP